MSEPVVLTPKMKAAFFEMMDEYKEFLDKAIEDGTFFEFSTKDFEEKKQQITENYIRNLNK